MIQHVVQICHLPLLVPDDWEAQVGVRDLVDVAYPSGVRGDGVCGQADELDVALGEFGLEFGESAQLGGADRGVVLWMREEDDPGVADVLVEVDGAGGRLGLEVWSNGAEAKTIRCCQ